LFQTVVVSGAIFAARRKSYSIELVIAHSRLSNLRKSNTGKPAKWLDQKIRRKRAILQKDAQAEGVIPPFFYRKHQKNLLISDNSTRKTSKWLPIRFLIQRRDSNN
jgi:hypothetical protein